MKKEAMALRLEVAALHLEIQASQIHKEAIQEIRPGDRRAEVGAVEQTRGWYILQDRCHCL